MKVLINTILFSCLLLAQSEAQRINELHYDNIGSDMNEFIEVVLPSGSDPSPYSLVFISGFTETAYNNRELGLSSFSVSEENEDYYTIIQPGIMNGTPNGVALVFTNAIDTSCNVLQFISYEGVIIDPVGLDVCSGASTSTDIGVVESGATPIGSSIEWNGTEWVIQIDDSPNERNRSAPPIMAMIPTMGQWMLFILALTISIIGLVTLFNNKNSIA